MNTVPGVIINVVLYAILFPVLMRVATGKWLGWLGTLVAVVVYVAVGLLLQHIHAVDWLLGLVGVRLS